MKTTTKQWLKDLVKEYNAAAQYRRKEVAERYDADGQEDDPKPAQ